MSRVTVEIDVYAAEFSPQHLLAVEVLGKLVEARLKAKAQGPSIVIVREFEREAIHRFRGRDGKITEKRVDVHRGLDARTLKTLRNAQRYARVLEERRKARAA